MNKFKRFVKIFYNLEYSEDFFLDYQNFIDAAIFNDNFEALECLWQGIYWHDRDCPDYNHDVYFAAKHGSLKMFQHILWSQMNNNVFDYFPLNANKIRENAAKNKLVKIRIFIDKFFFGINGEISTFSEDLLQDYKKNYEKIQDDNEDLKRDLAMDIFYVEVMLERVRTLCVKDREAITSYATMAALIRHIDKTHYLYK